MNTNNNSNNSNNNAAAAASSSGSNGVVYRSLKLATTSSAVKSMAQAQSQFLTPPQLTKQSQQPNAMKQRLVIVEPAPVALTTTTQAEVIAAELPLPMEMYPLSKTHAYLREVKDLNAVMVKVCNTLGGRLNATAGRVEAEAANCTKVRVTALSDPASGKIVLEFDRLEGCAFVFRWAFLKALVEAAEYLDIEEDETRHLLENSEKKLSFWLPSAKATSAPSLTRSVQVSV